MRRATVAESPGQDPEDALEEPLGGRPPEDGEQREADRDGGDRRDDPAGCGSARERAHRRRPPGRVASARPRKESCARASRMRSKTIEASRAGNGRPRSRARIAGRRISPARAGRTVLAAKPIAVARNAGKKGTRPSGRRIQTQRTARRTKVESEMHDARGEPGRGGRGDLRGRCRPVDTRERKNGEAGRPRERSRPPAWNRRDAQQGLHRVTGITRQPATRRAAGRDVRGAAEVRRRDHCPLLAFHGAICLKK